MAGAGGVLAVAPRVELRFHTSGDADDLLVFHSDPDVVRYIPWPVRDREGVVEALAQKVAQVAFEEDGQWMSLAVEERTTQVVVGETLLHLVSKEQRKAELGFVLRSDRHGQGLAYEAVQATLTLAFDRYDMETVEACCVDVNVSSARLLERVGMRRVAHLHHDVELKGEWVGQYRYAVDATSWSPCDHVESPGSHAGRADGLRPCAEAGARPPAGS